MIVAKYLGNLTDYLVLRGWQERVDYADFMASPAGKFPESKPPGIYVSQPVEHNWQEVASTPGYASGAFLWRSRYNVAPIGWDEFLRLRSEADKLLQWFDFAAHSDSVAGALVDSRTFRNLDDPTSALSFVRLTSRQAMHEILASPSANGISARMSGHDKHPGSAQAPRDCLFSDCFEIVSEFPPKE